MIYVPAVTNPLIREDFIQIYVETLKISALFRWVYVKTELEPDS